MNNATKQEILVLLHSAIKAVENNKFRTMNNNHITANDVAIQTTHGVIVVDLS